MPSESAARVYVTTGRLPPEQGERGAARTASALLMPKGGFRPITSESGVAFGGRSADDTLNQSFTWTLVVLGGGTMSKEAPVQPSLPPRSAASSMSRSHSFLPQLLSTTQSPGSM